MIIVYILIAILIFSFLIFIHELGHFVAAKKLGVQVNEFAICMGPVLWQRTKGETTYSIRAIPIGGFCAMEGEDEDSSNPRAFNSVAWWRRAIILVAGAFMNFVAGFLLVVLLMSSYSGFTEMKITGFFDNGDLEAQGLQVGDTLYALDGERIYISGDLEMLCTRDPSGVYDVTVLRDGEEIVLEDFNLQKGMYELDGQQVYMYGLQFTGVEKTVGTVLKYAWYNCRDFVRLVRLGVQDLISGRAGLSDISGPVGIVGAIAETGEQSPTVTIGLLNILYLAGFLAVNLAVVNLLPLPALDGGRVVCLLLTTVAEKLLRRKINPKYEGYLHAAGMVALMALMVYVSFQDVFRIFGG